MTLRIAPTVLLVLACSATARAQCCLGAQDVKAEGGAYRVVATSLTGTGPSKHGPFRYRFQWSEGEAAGPAFELAFDLTAHFRMQLFVSPTGNGFLMSTSLSKEVTFFAPSGEPLVTLDVARFRVGFEREMDPFFVPLRDAVARPVEGGFTYDPAGALFLPLGAPLEGRLREQVLDGLALDPAGRPPREAHAAELVGLLDRPEREQAVNELRRLGPSTLPALEARAAAQQTGGVDPIVGTLLAELAPWRAAGGLAALDDPRLLAGLLGAKDAELEAAARRRLEALPDALAPGADAAAWRAWAESRRAR